MAYDPNKGNFIPPCDLCGSFKFETLRSPAHELVRRCGECGLIAVEHRTGQENGGRQLSSRGHSSGPRLLPFLPPFKRALGRRRNNGVASVLLIGAESLAFHAAARRVGAKVTALLEPGTPAPAEVAVHDLSIDLARFIPEQFDVIVCAGCLESIESPALLFDRARTWLSTGGVLIIGSRNARSLTARLWRSRWLEHNARGVEHLLSPSTISRYAAKSGFEVSSIRARSTASLVRRFLSRNGHLSLFGQLVSLPVTATSNVFNLGDELWMELVKRGVMVRPILKPLEEEQSPGLAPAALYTGMQREAVLIDR